ncbi:DNA topoisomerase I [Stetteria hydrogenophila]
MERCWVPEKRIAVVAEKPKAAEKIALALAQGRPVKCSVNGIPVWVLRHNGSWVVVAPSAGHMYGPHSRRRGYPVFDLEWRPLWEFESGSRHLYKFYQALKRVLPGSMLYVNACDYDVEGSVIGYMIILHLGDVRRARRMKFSSLSPVELRRAFHRLEPLDMEMVEAGMARNELDWLWGVNVSRALMDAVRRVSGRRVILSAGRVQSPTLVEAVRRWRELNLHVPEPRFTVWVEVEWRGERFRLTLAEPQPSTRSEAAEVVRSVKNAGALRVVESSSRRARVRPPPAFNLGDLQSEAARLYRYSPAKTQQLAEDLYLDALISYPRTNSQKLPPTIDYKSIIASLTASPLHGALAARLLRETGGVLRPVQGLKEDPAHPAIHPTGQVPSQPLDRDHARIYDLVVRRFLAAFAGDAVVARNTVAAADSEGRLFKASGVKVVVEGWLHYYPYARPGEERVPAPPPGSLLRVVNAGFKTYYTKPSQGLSRMELLRWMERVNIGTEGTRARIIETLFKRGYLESRGGRVAVTGLGEAVASIIESLFPDLATPDLTREFERMLEDIQAGRRSRAEVVESAKRVITMLINSFRERLDEVGEELALTLGYARPTVACVVCGRHAEHEVGGYTLCTRHAEAVRRMASKVPLVARRLGVSPEDVVRRLAEGWGHAGAWVVEAAKVAVRDPGFMKLVTSRPG